MNTFFSYIFLPTNPSFHTRIGKKIYPAVHTEIPFFTYWKRNCLDIRSNSRITFGAATIRRHMHAWKVRKKVERDDHNVSFQDSKRTHPRRLNWTAIAPSQAHTSIPTRSGRRAGAGRVPVFREPCSTKNLDLGTVDGAAAGRRRSVRPNLLVVGRKSRERGQKRCKGKRSNHRKGGARASVLTYGSGTEGEGDAAAAVVAARLAEGWKRIGDLRWLAGGGGGGWSVANGRLGLEGWAAAMWIRSTGPPGCGATMSRPTCPWRGCHFDIFQGAVSCQVIVKQILRVFGYPFIK